MNCNHEGCANSTVGVNRQCSIHLESNRSTAIDRLRNQKFEAQQNLAKCEQDLAIMRRHVELLLHEITEVTGCANEYIAMPCSSLRRRMRNAVLEALLRAENIKGQM